MNSTLSAELHSLSKHKTSSLHHPMCVAVPHYVECHLSYRDAWKKCLVSSPHTNNRTLTLSTSTSIPTSSELQAKWEDWRLTRNPRSWRHQLSLVSQWSYLSTQGSQHSEGYWEGRPLTLSWHSSSCSGRSTTTPSLIQWDITLTLKKQRTLLQG